MSGARSTYMACCPLALAELPWARRICWEMLFPCVLGHSYHSWDLRVRCLSMAIGFSVIPICLQAMFACKIRQGVGAWLPHCKCKSSRHECFEKNQVLELGTYCGYSAMVWLGTTIFSAVAAGKILTPFSGPIATLAYVQWPEESIQGSVGCLKLSQSAWSCSLVKITVVLPWPSHSCGESCVVQYTSNSLDEKTMRTVRHY